MMVAICLFIFLDVGGRQRILPMRPSQAVQPRLSRALWGPPHESHAAAEPPGVQDSMVWQGWESWKIVSTQALLKVKATVQCRIPPSTASPVICHTKWRRPKQKQHPLNRPRPSKWQSPVQKLSQVSLPLVSKGKPVHLRSSWLTAQVEPMFLLTNVLHPKSAMLFAKFWTNYVSPSHPGCQSRLWIMGQLPLVPVGRTVVQSLYLRLVVPRNPVLGHQKTVNVERVVGAPFMLCRNLLVWESHYQNEDLQYWEIRSRCHQLQR